MRSLSPQRPDAASEDSTDDSDMEEESTASEQCSEHSASLGGGVELSDDSGQDPDVKTRGELEDGQHEEGIVDDQEPSSSKYVETRSRSIHMQTLSTETSPSGVASSVSGNDGSTEDDDSSSRSTATADNDEEEEEEEVDERVKNPPCRNYAERVAEDNTSSVTPDTSDEDDNDEIANRNVHLGRVSSRNCGATLCQPSSNLSSVQHAASVTDSSDSSVETDDCEDSRIDPMRLLHHRGLDAQSDDSNSTAEWRETAAKVCVSRDKRRLAQRDSDCDSLTGSCSGKHWVSVHPDISTLKLLNHEFAIV